MDSGFSYGDIIVIGVIAAFILLRYRAMLGESSGADERPSTPPQEFERVIQLPAMRVVAAAEKKDDFNEKYGVFAESYTAMRAMDREFSPDEFIAGARMAYEMVIAAYSKPDHDTLKMLLSDAIYQNFDRSLKASEAEGKRHDTTLVAITKAEVVDARLSGNLATIAVAFTSEQVQLVRDAAGTILEGDPSHEQLVEDRWVFTRNLALADPNWKVIET